MRKLTHPYELFKAKLTKFKKEVVDFLIACGFDSTVDHCPDSSYVVSKHRSLKQGLYRCMQKNIVGKANLTASKNPRIVLRLNWCTSGWGKDVAIMGSFFKDMDVETDRDGWQYRVQRSLAMMEEVAEDKQTNNPKCPKCNGLMIEKQMKAVKEVETEVDSGGPSHSPLRLVGTKQIKHPHYGEWFWGCLAYPECRGMEAYWIPKNQDKDVGNIVKDVTCPECDSKMVIRQARRGINAGSKFLGCICYPVCKGTLSMEKALALVLMRGDG